MLAPEESKEPLEVRQPQLLNPQDEQVFEGEEFGVKVPTEDVIEAIPIYDSSEYPDDVQIGAPILGQPTDTSGMPYPNQRQM